MLAALCRGAAWPAGCWRPAEHTQARAGERPHPGPQLALPPGFDGIASWHSAGLPPLVIVPENAASRDRLHMQPHAQVARQSGAHACLRLAPCPHQPRALTCLVGLLAAIGQIIGSREQAWLEILHFDYRRFVAAYDAWLAH